MGEVATAKLPLRRGLAADGKTYIFDAQDKMVAVTHGLFHGNLINVITSSNSCKARAVA